MGKYSVIDIFGIELQNIDKKIEFSGIYMDYVEIAPKGSVESIVVPRNGKIVNKLGY